MNIILRKPVNNSNLNLNLNLKATKFNSHVKNTNVREDLHSCGLGFFNKRLCQYTCKHLLYYLILPTYVSVCYILNFNFLQSYK